MQNKYSSTQKRRLRKKFHRKYRGKYVKDEAIKNFILQHSQKVDIDFSKIEIPSFLNCLKEDKKDPQTKKIKHLSFIDILSGFQLPKNSVNSLSKPKEMKNQKSEFVSSLFED